MSIKFACSCGKAYKVPDQYSGKKIKCKKCGEAIRVPSESQSSIASQRTSAVSKRSVLASKRIGKASGVGKGSGIRKSASGKSSGVRESSKSGRKSSRVKSSRLKSDGAKSGRTKARSSKRSKRVGGSTERFTPLDLVDGNKIKKYQRKREDDEFGRGEGRVTYYENGKPRKAFKIGRDGATVGRDDKNSVSVPMDSVSSEHLKIEFKLGTFIATDMQSTNGLLVNGRSVRRASLKSGDVLQLGEAILRLDCG